MTIRTPLARAIRLAIGGAAGLSAAFAAPLASAQDDQTVYVTGSRIGRGSDFESPSPVITVDREAIENSGYHNLQQLLEKMPVNGNGAFSTRGNNQDSSANGAASISLRGLGADATLVLVNGRRVAISSFAESITTNFVDINAIPVSAIERVEVLKDGASAVYGSDAVAGVINIVLRDDFDGFEVSAGYGDVTEGSSSETTASAIWGTSGEDSNITVIFDWFKNTRLGNAERGPMGSANQSARGGDDQRSSRGFPGRFFVPNGVPPDPDITRDPGCPAAQVAGQTCLYDYGPWNLLIPASERTGLVVQGRKGLGSGVEVFTEIAVQHNTSEAQGAPTPLDETAGLTLNNHPNDPYVGTNAVGISRFRTVDAGPRQWDIKTDNLRGVLGLRGTINDAWDWEVAYERASSESTQTGDRSMGWVRTDFLQQQLTSGAYNPFGGTINPEDVINQITTSLVRQGEADLTAYNAQITGRLFDMSAGPVMLAAGAEYREESASDVPDDQFQRGLIFGTEAVAAAASRDITSAFVEFSVPLAESLELSLAGRYDDYSDFGDTFNPKVAFRWSATDQLALRASWGEGFRAPSLAQIGLGQSDDSAFLGDSYGCLDNPAYCTATDFTIRFSGNPDLAAETSESYNIGAVWQPTDAMSFSVDYWNITQDDKIDRGQIQTIYADNCNNQASTICVRGAPLAGDTLGPIQFIRNRFVNINKQEAEGIDFAMSMTRDVRKATVTVGLDYTHLLAFDKTQVASVATDGTITFETIEWAGDYEYPEDRAALTSAWQIGDWGINTRLNYISSFHDGPPEDPSDPGDVARHDRTVGSYMTTNLQFTYTGLKNTKVALSIDNALDEDPPFAVGDGDTDLYGYVRDIHNPRGRFWSLKTTYSF